MAQGCCGTASSGLCDPTAELLGSFAFCETPLQGLLVLGGLEGFGLLEEYFEGC